MNGQFVFSRGVQIGEGTTIKGTIKSYGKIVLEDNVTIDGNIFSDGDIVVGRNARISGHVFSQKSIVIFEKTIIGHPDRIKSVVGKKSIRIEKHVLIYGFASTEGSGIVQ